MSTPEEVQDALVNHDMIVKASGGESANIKLVLCKDLDGVIFLIEDQLYIELPVNIAKAFLVSSLSAIMELSNG